MLYRIKLPEKSIVKPTVEGKHRLVCKWCKANFLGRANSDYCSSSCRQYAYRDRVENGYNQICIVCGKSFKSAVERARYCSGKCRGQAHRERHLKINKINKINKTGIMRRFLAWIW